MGVASETLNRDRRPTRVGLLGDGKVHARRRPVRPAGDPRVESLHVHAQFLR
jgi:hypothetical protein